MSHTLYVSVSYIGITGNYVEKMMELCQRYIIKLYIT